jgi:malonate-semialdehyde dehydrogenase (acetylating)/methylmalonate-semialdehyde dehydrogenase
VVTVGNTKDWIPDIMERAQKLKVDNGFVPDADLFGHFFCFFRRSSCCSGPVITPQAKAKIEKLIASAESQGGKILLDGRNPSVNGYPDGNWVGPTIVECTTEMDAYKEEIFGPVLTIVHAETLDEALHIINSNKCALSRV